jgi:hypothetical protein
MTSGADVIAARKLRDAARGIVKTDIATVRLELGQRSIPERVRDQVVRSVTQVADDGLALVNDNRAVAGLTIAAVTGWLLRRPLGTLSGYMCSLSRRTFRRWRL